MTTATFSGEGGRMDFEAWFAKWGWVVIGLTFGFAAKYALRIKAGLKVKPWQVFADILLLPMVGLIAYAIASRLGIEGEIRGVLTGFCMLGADKLVTILTDWFMLKVQAWTLHDVRQELINESGELRQTVQTADSARAVAGRQQGREAPQGDDTSGRLAHRLPPFKGD